jgi:hypothetical protein
MALTASEDRESHGADAGDHREYCGDRARRCEREEESGNSLFFRLLTMGENDSPDRSWLADARAGLYQSECGACHLAYPPMMLPAVSWQATIATLEDHFGENAELDRETSAQIQSFLGNYAAAYGSGGYAERMWRATRGKAAPLRITETDYFVGQHHEIPLTMVKDNTEVGSFSRCEACHVHATEGSFDEHEVRIAGHGEWDD